MKTALQVQTDVRDLLIGSPLAKSLSGGVYHAGTRPRGSTKEDAVITLTTADAEQVQMGVVTITIFVPNITPRADGAQSPNLKRLAEIEAATQLWVAGLNPNAQGYSFRLGTAIASYPDDDAKQYFVSCKIKFYYFDEV